MIKQLLVVITFLFSIALQAQNNDHKPYQYNLQATLWQQQSGEYKALCYQAFHLAKLRLTDILLTNKDTMPMAIITDVDETILDNSPGSVHDMRNNHGYTDSSWHAWVELANAKAMPGAMEFFTYAAQHGVQCFYITNRKDADKAATIKNLQQQGFPQVNEMHVMTRSTTSDKEPRRLEVAKKYNVVLLLGDNLNDFSDLFFEKQTTERNADVDKAQVLFGSKYIILPNAVYGDWESALWKNQKLPADPKEKNAAIDKIKWDSLIGY